MSELRKNLVQNMRVLMRENGVNQSQVAKAIGTTSARLSSWMHEENFPSDAYLEKIGFFFGVEPHILLAPNMKELTVKKEVTETDAFKVLADKLGYQVKLQKNN